MNEVLKNIEARHSVRAYTQRQLSVEALDQILRAAVCAPNGMHLQTWHFTAIQNPRVLCELNNRVKAVSMKYIPFEPKGWQKDFRDELRKMLSVLCAH